MKKIEQLNEIQLVFNFMMLMTLLYSFMNRIETVIVLFLFTTLLVINSKNLFEQKIYFFIMNINFIFIYYKFSI